MKNMEKGQIWYVELPSGIGHEQGGRRPGIIFGAEVGGMVVVIPMTTKLDRTRSPFTELIPSGPTTCLEQTSVALVFQMRAVSTDRMSHQIGCIDGQDIEKINGQISGLLSLSA